MNALGGREWAVAVLLDDSVGAAVLFSKEDGDQCHLQWAANAEQKLQGYRVYRMEGPKLNGPGQPVTRLTAESIVAIRKAIPTPRQRRTRFSRYWIVAVDVLGQEGFPSAPSWHYRQYRK